MTVVFVVGIASIVIAWLAFQPLAIARRRARLRARPFPAAWREIIARRVPYISRMPAALRAKLEGHVQVFMHEKNFVGCDGFQVTDEVRLTIATQACLLILARESYYFPKLSDILVYPSPFVVERITGGPMLQTDSTRVLSGESWARGQVVLSWSDVAHGAAIDHDGRNVVIHEFAHQLDQEKGYANGAPWLGRGDRYPRWSRIMNEEFARLQYQAATGQPSLFNTYGATEPAEFFAVVSEAFIEQPRIFAHLHPALYEELRGVYGVDPRYFDWSDQPPVT
ncbi:MAG TPA: M90 family metallopeptidase [Usitatibacter sp.]|nr:M90 family metallopeptidase [Usitatibacter sp.]